MFVYFLLFILGFFEEFLAVIYYGFVRKSWRIPCAILSMVRSLIWIVTGASVFASFLDVSNLQHSFHEFFLRALIYIISTGIGNYLSLLSEPFIHKKILHLQTKGRRKTRWDLIGARK